MDSTTLKMDNTTLKIDNATATYLRQHGIRLSIQRMAVMDFLLTHRTHPTVETIYAALYPAIPTLSKKTVYNTLAALVEKGAAKAIDIDAQHTRYDGICNLHGHFLCDVHKEVFDIPLNSNASLLDVLNPSGFSTRDTQLLFKGVCKECNCSTIY